LVRIWPRCVRTVVSATLELSRDLGVGEAAGDELENVELAGGQAVQSVRYCSGMQAPGQAQPDCVTPFGVQNAMTARRGEYVAASTSGETLPLTEGTYTFATIVMPQAHNLSQTSDSSGDTVVTKVLVRDAAAPEPSGVSIP
jgi:hypothetical protein